MVNDSRGFYTSRVFGTYVSEGIAMLAEGIHPRSIEVAGLKAGMPMPPLALQDEVSLSLSLHIMQQTKRALEAEGKTFTAHPAMPVVEKMVNDLGREGKKVGKGFYDYPENGEKRLWPELTKLYPTKDEQPSQHDLVDRLLYVQANETAKCYEENVVRSVADANVGSIFGLGFAPNQGGTLQFINSVGVKKFVERSRELAAAYGERFQPANILVQMAEKDQEFSDE